MEAMFADSETGASITVTWIGEAMDGQDKGVNKALTAAVKYGLLKTMLASTGEDDPDGAAEPERDNGHKEVATTHWIENRKVAARFWMWTRDKLGLDDEEVHQALNVTSVKDFPGGMENAKMLIEAWVDSKAKEPAHE